MNRLILIGNGFDLAHKIKTSYKDFILDYLRNAFKYANNYNKYTDQLLSVMRSGYYKNWLNNGNDDVDKWDLNNFYAYIEQESGMSVYVGGTPTNTYRGRIQEREYTLEIKSNLISKLLSSCKEYNWVDIENEYYKILCELSSENKEKEILELNNGFQFLQSLLYAYLIKIEEEYLSNKYNVSKSSLIPQLLEPIEHNAAPKSAVSYKISANNSTPKTITTNKEPKKPKPNSILFLNFNYTSTIESYVKEIQKTVPNTDVIYIHGKLNDKDNPMIFGYGDEEETNFEVLEKYDECLKYVKTYWYLRTPNYETFLKFIDSDEFEVYIMGHSCGMSDKTMLSSIFNNPNCKKIKALTYDKSFGSKDLTIDTTDYIEKTYQIGRLFKNKADLRKKLIPFETKDLLKIDSNNLELENMLEKL
ncbi:AbiH family protein [Chryseobacterium sp. YIM B08800]|uniref:AbiH family protein n=1 Tax=Chryseobacterium sp. YIM B08800 TaxID=2984136 RepID=UPI002240745E|nr:AbiH family protein [Chryseobacterium sp. YIM B08800]